MDWMELLQQLFEVVLIPMLGVGVAFFCKWVNAKAAELNTKTDNELHAKYINMLAETITDCVKATNQTYVDAMKGKNAFDTEAQKEAFDLTYNAVISILSQDAQEYLVNAYGDLNQYVIEKIEAEVNKQKTVQKAVA